jgi:NAD(P)-dependent dehydrogenase (short-subunit alcohol dehydrogenase family)
MTTPTLTGRRLLVVGASSGIGRAVAIGAVRAGAEVVMTARRKNLLDDAVTEAGGGTAVAADVAKPDDCTRAAEEAARHLGQIDLVVFAAGMAPLRRLEETTADDWATTMATNVVGLNLITSALLPSLAPGAVVAALSSEAVDHARYGLAAYGASKAALDASLRHWRVEHPELRFTCVAIGPTVGTDFGAGFERALLASAYRAWTMQGLTPKEYMTAEGVAEILLGILATSLAVPGVALEHVALQPPSGPFDDTDLAGGTGDP